jgi:hypothetical protein
MAEAEECVLPDTEVVERLIENGKWLFTHMYQVNEG